MPSRTILLNGSAAALLAAAAVAAFLIRNETRSTGIPSAIRAETFPSASPDRSSPSSAGVPAATFHRNSPKSSSPVSVKQSRENRTADLRHPDFPDASGQPETAATFHPSSRGSHHRPASPGRIRDDRTESLSSASPAETSSTTPSPDVLHFDGLRVEVHGFDKPENGGDLLISVTPDPESATDPRNPVRSVEAGGFSLQDQLFRAKWGWVAYDQAKRAALEAAEGIVR